jgi:hypothetical protein
MMKKNLPVIVALLVAFAFSYIYFSPLLTGKRLKEYDKQNALGASKEAVDYYHDTGDVAKWSNSMFGGMPTVTIWLKFKTNIAKLFRKVEKAGIYPATLFIILIMGAYLCLILFGVNPWLSIPGSLTFALATHFFILTDVGHITKLWALAYTPPLIASIYYTFTKKRLIGAILTALFLSLEISAVHPQVTYYVLIAVFFLGLALLVKAIINKTINPFLKSFALLLVSLVLAVGVNAGYLLSTQEYTKYSTRGENIIRPDENTGETGLDKDYILDYSYDVTEALTAFIPRLKGGSMHEPLSENSALYQAIEKSQGRQRAKKFVESAPLYWGSQPIVSGPFYFGAITVFLFVLGLFSVRGKEKWWLVSVVIVSFLLSLGKYFPALSHFAIDYIPLYNKFRDVKNIVFIQHFAMWLMGILALKALFQNNSLQQNKKISALKYSTIITGGIALVFAIIPSLAGSFSGNIDQQLTASGWSPDLLELLREDRLSVARADSFRSLIFVLLTAGLIWATLKEKIKPKYALIIGSILVLADLLPVNKKYLNNDDFVSKRKTETAFEATPANKEILKDKSLNYRVLNMSVNPFSDASTSYYHQSVGGYSGAKLQRYQDIIEYHIAPEMQLLGSRLGKVKTQKDLDLVFAGLNTINMLNTKYIIYNPNAAPLLNKEALGNAWYVSDYMLVENANEEIEAIDDVEVSNTAIIHKEFENLLAGKEIRIDSSAVITLKSYEPNRLVYKTSSQSEQLAVFSEVYYPKGWYVYIDGKEARYFRANYILRSMFIPAGEHEIVFEFKPKSYEIGNKISLASSVLMLLAIAGVVFFEIKKREK